MATSYTSLLGFALPVTGELSGSWGTTVNDSITQLAEDSIASTATASVTGGDWTLSTTGAGVANEARRAILIPTGTPGVSRNIVAPSQSKSYIVVNQSDAAVVLKGAATSGTTISAGKTSLCAWNGSDFVTVAGNLVDLTTDVTGTLPVANGGTGLTSAGASGNVLTSNGSIWTSAVLPAGGLTYVVKTTTYTTQDKEGVLADTSGGSFTVTLPATPSLGAQVVIADPTGDWGSNNLTIGRNGSTIAGVAQDLVCDISGAAVQLVYDGTTWTVYAQVGGNGGTVVTLTGTQTLTNKTLTAPALTNATGSLSGITVNDGYTEEVYAIPSSTTPALSPTNGSIQTWTLTGNSTPTAGTWADGQSMTLMIDDGTAYTITWTSVAVTWKTDGGSAPTLNTSGYTAIQLWKVGSTIYGARVGDA